MIMGYRVSILPSSPNSCKLEDRIAPSDSVVIGKYVKGHGRVLYSRNLLRKQSLLGE
jgi:hypothetical protein